MALKKISEEDLTGKGVRGQADVPGLSAAEMQAKVEEIVRDVVIPNINDNVTELAGTMATKEDLENLTIAAGAVTSVFGRRGAVTAQKGDYTPEQVGAAAAKHAREHAPDGGDPLDPEIIGAAPAGHSHGNITHDGKVGSTNGKILMTGLGGTVIAADRDDTGLLAKPTLIATSGEIAITIEDNREYEYTGVTSLTMVGANVECHGTIAFAGEGAPTVSVSGFAGSAGDDITTAGAGEEWEFSAYKNKIIWKNWGVCSGT